MNCGDRLSNICDDIQSQCIQCHQCMTQCIFLKTIGEGPDQIARRGPTCEEAYSCSLCRLCEAVCPANLSLRDMFGEARIEAVRTGQIHIDDYKYIFPDRPDNVMSLFREYCQIDYGDLKADQEGEFGFFPGCTMLTYAPQLTRALFGHLDERHKNLTMLTDCCSIPLSQLGMERRADQYAADLETKLVKLGIKSLVTACPNCYYRLSPLLKKSGIAVLTIYEALKDTAVLQPLPEKPRFSLTVHDSCPDRLDQIFSRQARAALTGKGYRLKEMERSFDRTVCCGSGGQVTHFQPELAEQMVRSRLKEAEDTGAELLTGYCLSCVLNFAKTPGSIRIQHVLNLLLDMEQDYAGLKLKAKAMFEGPEGESYWQRAMED